MSYLGDRLVEFFSSVDQRLEARPLLVAVRRGLIYMIPLILLGSVALLVLSLPVPAYQQLMTTVFGAQWTDLCDYIRDGTFGVLSLIMVLTVSYAHAEEYALRHHHDVSPIIASSVSLASLIALSGISRDGFSLSSFGAVGVFAALAVAVTASALFLQLGSLKFLRIKAFTDGANSTFNSAITSIYPAAITVTVFAAINRALAGIFGIEDIQAFVSRAFSQLVVGVNSPFWSGVLFILLIHLFWFLGMHGSNLLEPVAQSVFVPALVANQVAISLGQTPSAIFTKTFFDTFVLMGGCGTALCLVLAVLLAGRQKNRRRLARLSLAPVLFNINELIVFGLPIVLNPIYLVPFLVTPLALTLTSYLAVHSGLVPPTSHLVEWTTPVLLSGYASTGAIRGSLLQLLNLAIGTLCYVPFVRLAERVADARVKRSLHRVYAQLDGARQQVGAAGGLLSRHDDIGDIARSLAADLDYDLSRGRLMLHYQPQVDYAGNVFGLEALLRWKHESYGFIYPPLVIALAEESQLIDKLGSFVLETACADQERLRERGLGGICISVNVSARQLDDERFLGNLQETMRRHQTSPGALEVEITEQLALTSSSKVFEQIKAIRKLGVRLAMDDFGMGHSSLLYLKEYEFDTVKLDGSLVREILVNSNCRNIISSIVSLGQSLHYTVVAEYVEQEAQRQLLHELGCDRYQGYLYSKALPLEQLIPPASRTSLPAGLAVDE